MKFLATKVWSYQIFYHKNVINYLNPPTSYIQYSSHASLQSHSCSHKSLKKSLRNLAISYWVHEKRMSSRMHVKIFTTRQGYLSIETCATAVFVSELVMPCVVRTSRCLNQEKHSYKRLQCVCTYIYVGVYMHYY